MISTFNHERSCRLTCFCFFNAFFRLSNQLNTPKFGHSHPSFDYDSFCMPLSKTRAERMYCLPMTSLQPTAQSQQWMNKGGDSAVSAKRQLPLISFVAFLISFEFRGRHWSDDGHVVWLITLHFSFSLPCCAHSFGFFQSPFCGKRKETKKKKKKKKMWTLKTLPFVFHADLDSIQRFRVSDYYQTGRASDIGQSVFRHYVARL